MLNNIQFGSSTAISNCPNTVSNPPSTHIGSQVSDKVTLSTKPKEKRLKKLLLFVGAIATALIGTVLAIKGIKAHQLPKDLKTVENKFLKLQENMPKVQKTFKDVFMRDDLTEKEALEMLNRYKEVEKIGVTGTKEEYIKAAFEEAKRNYGFENINLPLKFVIGKTSANGTTMGGSAKLLNRIEINPKIKKEQVLNVIHHELRHTKQNFYAFNLNPAEYVSNIEKNRYGLQKNELKEVLDDCKTDICKIWGNPDINRIPNKYKDFANKCMVGHKNYVDGHENIELYDNNFLEVGARFAAEAIGKLFS